MHRLIDELKKTSTITIKITNKKPIFAAFALVIISKESREERMSEAISFGCLINKITHLKPCSEILQFLEQITQLKHGNFSLFHVFFGLA
jgi:hypothetical protein